MVSGNSQRDTEVPSLRAGAQALCLRLAMTSLWPQMFGYRSGLECLILPSCSLSNWLDSLTFFFLGEDQGTVNDAFDLKPEKGNQIFKE